MKYPAICEVHWPSGPIFCCKKHAEGLIKLSKMLGSHLAVTNIHEEKECSNCKNEGEK